MLARYFICLLSGTGRVVISPKFSFSRYQPMGSCLVCEEGGISDHLCNAVQFIQPLYFIMMIQTIFVNHSDFQGKISAVFNNEFIPFQQKL